MKTAKVTIRLLREFTVESPELGVSELSRRLLLDKATVHRLLRALSEEGIIEQDPDTKKYRLGLAILDLAAARLQAFGFIELALDEMRKLREVVGETVGLHVRDGNDMVCLQYSQASHPLTVRFWLGERSPLHVTATGLVFLGEMSDTDWVKAVDAAARAYPDFPAPSHKDMSSKISRVRRDGISLADESYQKGVRGMATAIRQERGAMVATLSIVAPVSRLTTSELLKYRPSLVEAAKNIGRKIPPGMGVLAANILEVS